MAYLQRSQSLKRVAPHELDSQLAMLASSCLDRLSLHSRNSSLQLQGIRIPLRTTPISSADRTRRPCIAAAPRLLDRSSPCGASGPAWTTRSRTVDELTPPIDQLQVRESALLLRQVDTVAFDYMVHACRFFLSSSC